jgi:hypothetical protein
MRGLGARGGAFVYSLAVSRRPLFALSGHRWWKTWLVLAAVIFLVAVAVRALPAVRERLPTGKAQWIWKAMDRKDNYPTVFYAIRDFELESPPARARLLITADEEYVATLNGRRIGAGVYFRRDSGTTLDAYEVGPLLRAGGNRLMVELRSGRGTGGLLAALKDEAGEPILVSDESWRIFRKYELGLVRGWLSLGDESSEPAFCWGNPPLGRWGRPRAGPVSPLLPRAPLVPAVSARPLALNLGGNEVGRPPGSPVLYDWGREVEGYLTLDVPPSKEPGTGLLFTGAELPDPRRTPVTAPVLVLPGRHDWMDAQPRRFRYAVVVGLARPVTAGAGAGAASVLPAPARPMSRDPEEMKVFGIEGPRLRTPVEDEVWSKLQRLAGVARREEL